MTRKIGIDIGSLSVRTVLYGDGADITESPAVYSSVGGTVADIGSAAVRMNSGVPGAVTVLPFIPAGDELPDPDAAYTLFSGILRGYRIKKADIWLSLPADCGEEAEGCLSKRHSRRERATFSPFQPDMPRHWAPECAVRGTL